MEEHVCLSKMVNLSLAVADQFNWKLAAVIYLLLEVATKLLLKPRVYKKFDDTIVELQATSFLVIVFVLGIYSDFLSSVLDEGEAARADDSYCSNFDDVTACNAMKLCHWIQTPSDPNDVPNCAAVVEISSRAGLLKHIVYALPWDSEPWIPVWGSDRSIYYEFSEIMVAP